MTKAADDITLLDVYVALGEREVFALHPHEPNLDCPVGFGIRPVLGIIYDDVAQAVEQQLARQTIRDVLDRTLAVSAPAAV